MERLFVEKGFSNWHETTTKFSLREKSPMHRDAIWTLGHSISDYLSGSGPAERSKPTLTVCTLLQLFPGSFTLEVTHKVSITAERLNVVQDVAVLNKESAKCKQAF